MSPPSDIYRTKKLRQDLMDRMYHEGKYSHYNVCTHVLAEAQNYNDWKKWVDEGEDMRRGRKALMEDL